MRSISTIKSAVDKRPEDKPIPAKKTLKTPASVRDKQKKDDSSLKIQKQLEVKARALQEAIKTGNADLGRLRAEITSKTEKAIEAGGEIIDAAQKRAKNITADAHNTKGEANRLLNEAKTLSKELDKFEEKLKKRDVELGSAHEEASSRIKRATDTLKATKEKDQRSTEKLNQAQESLDSMFALLVAVIEKVMPIAENNDALLQTISTNVAKADKMYLQVLDMENANRIDKEVNDTRSDELDKKEIWLKDRRNLLKRVEKETKK